MEQPEQVSPRDAWERLNGGDADVYLDVRSTPEFTRGHPAGALHIPLLEMDPARGGMAPNPRFLEVVKAVIQPGQRVLVGCQAGGRSHQAAVLMLQSGFSSVANVAGGFGGQRDAAGRTVVAGWVECGLPVESGDGGESGYEALKARG